MLTSNHGRRIAVIENEFGEIDIDSDLVARQEVLEGTGDMVLQLNNGCLCCTVREDLVKVFWGLVETCVCHLSLSNSLFCLLNDCQRSQGCCTDDAADQFNPGCQAVSSRSSALIPPTDLLQSNLPFNVPNSKRACCCRCSTRCGSAARTSTTS